MLACLSVCCGMGALLWLDMCYELAGGRRLRSLGMSLLCLCLCMLVQFCSGGGDAECAVADDTLAVVMRGALCP
jgi:hypothetical protein